VQLQNGRWAMLAVAGILIPGAIIPGFAQWFDAGKVALSGSPFPYATLFAIQLFAFNFVEVKRWMDIRKPGSQGEPGSFLGMEGLFKGSDQGPGYPGGPFNPMGMGQGNMSEMQTKVRRRAAAARVGGARLHGAVTCMMPAAATRIGLSACLLRACLQL
jgi:light-harvesting complex I chlorophyll a/b binding protein 4